MKLLTVLVLLAVIVTIRAATMEQLKGNVAQFIKSNGNRVIYFTGSEGTTERHYIDSALEKWTNPNNVEVEFGNFEARKRTQELSVAAVGAKLGDLIWFNNGRKRATFKPDEYTKVEEIISWLTSSSVEALETISDPETLRLLTTECSGEHSSIILFSTEANTDAELDLLYLQNDYEPLFQFRAVRDANLLDKLSVKDNTIAVYQCFENEQGQIFKRNAKELGTGLSKWVLTHAAPYVSPATKLAFTRSQACFDHTILLVLEKEDKSFLDDVLKAAKEAKTFGFIYGYKKDARLVEKITQAGASGTKFPTAVALSANTQDRTIVWDENKKLNFASLSKWLEEIQTKQAVTFQKSAPVPPKTTGWIQPVVRSNFDEEVVTQSSTTPVVVFFTAPHEYCYACHGVEQDIKLAYDRANPNSVRVVSYNLHENANPIKQQVYPGDIIAFVDGTASAPYVPTQTVTKWLSKFVKFNNHDEL